MVPSTKDTKPDKGQVLRTYFVIKKEFEDLYLRQDVCLVMKEKDKWGSLEAADKFLGPEAATFFANRMTESEYEIVERDLPTTRFDGAFCRLPPK